MARRLQHLAGYVDAEEARIRIPACRLDEIAAGAAAAQGKFFEYTDLLYQRQDALDPESLKRYAAELGLNVKQFEIDFSSEKNAAEVQKDKADGEKYGIGSTPTIFVNGVRVRRFSPSGFRNAIINALGKR
jgi:protein-disulfide isomerase